MSKCQVKIVFEVQPNVVLIKDKKDSSILDSKNYDEIRQIIIDKSKSQSKGNNRLNNDDKFVLMIEGLDIPGLNCIWDTETYNYFSAKMEQMKPDKLKLMIKKVDKYPVWSPPQYTKLLQKYLKSSWEETKKGIEDELSEKLLNEGKRLFLQDAKINDATLTNDLFKELHINIICNNCLNSNFYGIRYVCSECNNFNVCELCKKSPNFTHNNEHTFIKINFPIIDVDIQKYNSIFSPNKLFLKENKYFQTNIKIVNNGENDLQGCFLSPIRFGKKYLGCIKATILEHTKRGEIATLKDVLIKFEDEDESEREDEYEGYFRLMTKQGIPFGDILYIRVIFNPSQEE